MGIPTGASAERIIRPDASALTPSSLPEQFNDSYNVASEVDRVLRKAAGEAA